jgi:phage-related protein
MAKDVEFLGDSLSAIRSFPPDARREAGFQIDRVQMGLDPRDWKPMSAIGPGVREIRIHASGAFRVIYAATFADAVYVLTAFQKKTQATPLRELEIARKRLKALKARMAANDP